MSGGAKEDHAEDVKKDQVKVQPDPVTGDDPVISWLRGQTEEGSFGSWGAWPSLSVFCHTTRVPSPRGDANPSAVLLASARAVPGGGRVVPAEVMNLDFSRSSLFIWRAETPHSPSTR